MCDCIEEFVMDLVTPRNAFLSGFYKRSFAYYTIKERLPRILTQSIDQLVRHKYDIRKQYGSNAREEIKSVIGEISKLKYEIQTNKPMQNITSNAPDAKLYNFYLAKQENVTYFMSVWLFAECYMYRRLHEIFELTTSLQSFDLFQLLKQESFFSTRPSMEHLSNYLVSTFTETASNTDIKEIFIKLLKINLWGNKCDLSFSAGVVENNWDPFALLNELQPNILSDQSEEIWLAVSNVDSTSDIVDIVLDNAGYELFTDLCLADFIITNQLATKIRIYVKSIPWFISDVTKSDFDWTLLELSNSDSQELNTLSERWQKYVQDKTWDIIDDNFFTLPIDYSCMETENPNLYKQLAEAKLIIFKGDLNYRKLFGEKNWDPTTPIEEGLQGFMPSKLAILRTIKCQLVCGLQSGIAENASKRSPDWQINGDYGLIQYCDKIRVID